MLRCIVEKLFVLINYNQLFDTLSLQHIPFVVLFKESKTVSCNKINICITFHCTNVPIQ